MSYDFNADEVFEMAEQIERNGVRFYREAALYLRALADLEVFGKDVRRKLQESQGILRAINMDF